MSSRDAPWQRDMMRRHPDTCWCFTGPSTVCVSPKPCPVHDTAQHQMSISVSQWRTFAECACGWYVVVEGPDEAHAQFSRHLAPTPVITEGCRCSYGYMAEEHPPYIKKPS